MDYNSIENQRIKDKFVGKHVHACVTPVIDALIKLSYDHGDLPISYEDTDQFCYYEYDGDEYTWDELDELKEEKEEKLAELQDECSDLDNEIDDLEDETINLESDLLDVDVYLGEAEEERKNLPEGAYLFSDC